MCVLYLNLHEMQAYYHEHDNKQDGMIINE